MAAIDTARRIELERLTSDLRRAARTFRALTLAERAGTRAALVETIRTDLEPSAQLDVQGLEALRAWTDALEVAEVGDIDLVQELLYGTDALVRVHLWRETGLPLAPPEPRPASDI
jgi:hypothetical protein